MSPVGLQWYLDRFRNAAPTHASKRKLTVPPSVQTTLSSQQSSSVAEKNVPETAEPADISDISNFSSIDTSASSFFNLRVSDATTSSDGTSLDQIEFEEIQPTVRSQQTISNERPCTSDVPVKRPSYSSQFQELFGKKFDEILEIVPSEIVNPATDEDDILFQWRLKRAMDEAKSNPVNDIPNHALYSETPNNSSATFWQNVQPSSLRESNVSAQPNVDPVAPLKVLREMDCQTDKELVTASCQVELQDLAQGQVSIQDAAVNIATEFPASIPETLIPTDVPVIKVPGIAASPVQRDVQTVKEPLLLSGDDDDFDSVSSYSDLTEISDLDELNDTVIPLPEAQDETAETLGLLHGTEETAEVSFNKTPEPDCPPETEVQDEGESSQMLRGYLQNILESFDDPILASFITKYDFVQERMRIVEELIVERDASESGNI